MNLQTLAAHLDGSLLAGAAHLDADGAEDVAAWASAMAAWKLAPEVCATETVVDMETGDLRELTPPPPPPLPLLRALMPALPARAPSAPRTAAAR